MGPGQRSGLAEAVLCADYQGTGNELGTDFVIKGEPYRLGVAAIIAERPENCIRGGILAFVRRIVPGAIGFSGEETCILTGQV